MNSSLGEKRERNIKNWTIKKGRFLCLRCSNSALNKIDLYPSIQREIKLRGGYALAREGTRGWEVVIGKVVSV